MAIQIKKFLIPLAVGFLLVGCEPPRANTTTAATESQATVGLNLTKGLEDCKLYWFTPVEDRRSITIVRCPNSTVSTNQEVTEGKITHVQTTITIDGVEYTPVVK